MQMRFLGTCLLLLGLLAELPAACAQDSTATVQPPPVVASPALPSTATDTAAALHRLFVAKRGQRISLVLGTALTGATALAVDGLFASDSRNALVGVVSQGRIIGSTLLIMLVEIVAHSDYNQKEEQAALAQWRLHRLPPKLRRQMKPRYFKLPGAPT